MARDLDQLRKSLSDKSYEFETLRQEVSALSEEINQVGSRIESFEAAKEAIKSFMKTKTNDQLIIPIGEGVFIKARIDKNENVLITVGSNVVVSKNIDEALEYISTRVDEADKIVETLNNNIILFNQRMQRLEYDLRETMSLIKMEEKSQEKK